MGKFWKQLFGKQSILDRKNLGDYRQEFIRSEGKKQFESLLKRGLQIPVSLA